MIRDFSNTFDGKQMVRVKPVRITDNSLFKRVVGVVMTSALVAGLGASMAFGFMIRDGLDELAGQRGSKLELIKVQQGLYEQRNVLLARENIEAAVRDLGLRAPQKRQVRHL